MRREMKLVVVIMVKGIIASLFSTSSAQQDGFQDAPCWKTISDCIGKNVNNTLEEPQFDQTSPLFNATEFLCCPLMQQTATIEKQCFCTINTFIQQNTSLALNISDFLSVCSLPNSPDSLDEFCQDGGSLESLKAASPTSNVKNTSGQKGEANKIATIESLYALLVLLTYFVVFY